MPARPAPTTYMNPKVRIKRKRQQLRQLIASSLVLSLAIIIVIATIGWRSESKAQNTDEIADTYNIDIIYTHDTLVIHNNGDDSVNLANIRFELATSNAIIFRAQDWVTQTINSGQCVQAWDSRFRYLLPQLPPSDICDGRVAYRATRYTFWVSHESDAEFIIKRGNTELARCSAIAPNSEETLHCLIEL